MVSLSLLSSSTRRTLTWVCFTTALFVAVPAHGRSVAEIRVYETK